MYLPAEIWRKIWMYTVVVDEHRSKLLSDIRNNKWTRLSKEDMLKCNGLWRKYD